MNNYINRSRQLTDGVSTRPYSKYVNIFIVEIDPPRFIGIDSNGGWRLNSWHQALLQSALIKKDRNK